MLGLLCGLLFRETFYFSVGQGALASCVEERHENPRMSAIDPGRREAAQFLRAAPCWPLRRAQLFWRGSEGLSH